MGQAISKLTIKGYKSIRNLENFELRNLNILIGPNGSGKSNFLSFAELLKAALSEDNETQIRAFGTANRLFYMGSKITKVCEFRVRFTGGVTGFKVRISLTPNPEDEVVGRTMFSGETTGADDDWKYLDAAQKNIQEGIRSYRLGSYHFHDTSTFAPLKHSTSEGNYDYLFPDASNLAPFLFRMKEKQPRNYQTIIEVVGLAAPFFHDFSFDRNEETGVIKWWWLQKGSDYKFHPSQISDGTLRFICLATALLQPNPPSTTLLDEPELGMHPYALTLLAGLIEKASKQTQVIVSTQSAALIDNFEPEDIVVVERQKGESIFKRLNKDDLKVWLDDYSLGELWEMNMFGGRPSHE